jgi:hypothetical protein
MHLSGGGVGVALLCGTMSRAHGGGLEPWPGARHCPVLLCCFLMCFSVLVCNGWWQFPSARVGRVKLAS